MSIQIQQVFDYLDTHPINQHSGNFTSLLEMLYNAYVEANSIDTVVIKEKFRQMDTILSKLPLSENDQLFYLVCDLCLEYERSAFAHGILVGMHLMTELNSLT
nr:hypothetical protein [Oscillospiraceae bacterium]